MTHDYLADLNEEQRRAVKHGVKDGSSVRARPLGQRHGPLGPARVIIVAPCMDIPERARSSRISMARPSIRSQRVSKRGWLVPNAATAVPRRRWERSVVA
jgi:hypothetical protein